MSRILADRLRSTEAAFAYAVSGPRVYGLLLAILLLTFFALALRGFKLGFYGDVVAHQFHFHFDGMSGWFAWLRDAWQRHLLGGLVTAPLHLLTPGRYDLWYALSYGAHFAVVPVVFLFVDTLGRGNRRWLAFAAALLFCFDSLQNPSHIDMSVGMIYKFSLLFALLSLYAYLRFVRGGRRQLLWHSVSVAFYAIAIMLYEFTMLFFLLHALIAYVEGNRDRRWLWLSARDSLLHVFIAGLYVYLLLSLFGRGNANLMLSPAYIMEQIGDGMRLLWSPAEIVSRVTEAAAQSPFWLLALLALLISLFFGLWIIKVDADSDADSPWTPGWIIVLGCLISLLSMANTAPASWKFVWHERLLYAASAGGAMTIVGLLALAVQRQRRVGGALFAAAMAILVAPAICFPFEYQAEIRQRDKTSRGVHRAIYAALPRFVAEASPYLLLLTDGQPEAELALSARDVNFPHIFAMRYGIRGFRADALLYAAAGESATQQIQLLEAGIVSPLTPDEIISYDRVVIVAYDHESKSAALLDELPQEALERGNFDNRAGLIASDIRTNRALMP